ncbi:rRNA-processing protein bfr2 [Orbilia brochopaga]|uniref:Protein BFR2 n=1 Tax=Orbilia brochopaga TaxID=3140254 RepID=A0AAV9V8H8_9PEZI
MPSRSLKLSEQVGKPKKAPKEFDPEAIRDAYASDGDDDSEDSSGEVDENAGREHYVEVGKSKLRRNQDIHLHPKYNGTTVSRDRLYEDDDSDDGDAAEDDEDEEGDSRDSEEENDEDEGDNSDEDDLEDDDGSEDGGVRLSISPALNGKARKNISTPLDDDSDEEIDDVEDMRSDESMDDDEDMEDDDDEDEGSELSGDDDGHNEKSERDELRNMMAQERKTVVANLSQAAKADAEKGLAVRSQRAFFDECLKSRMAIKNGLISVNSLPQEPLDSSDDTVRAAEDAAIALWNSLSQLRYDLAKSREGSEGKKSAKRKHEDITRDSSTNEVWKAMKRMESDSAGYRKSTLEKWSARVQATTNIVPMAKKLNQSAAVQTVSSQLREHLADLSGEVAKSCVPQESAPLQKAQKIDDDHSIYDDTDFYKRLLLVLLEQRGNSATNGGVVQLAPADLQELKAKKKKNNVDTKASKGRKLRYHVHEKLQNFMMPDDSLEWHEQQIDEFFSSLMGQRRRVLDEHSSDEEDGDEGAVPVAQLFSRIAA